MRSAVPERPFQGIEGHDRIVVFVSEQAAAAAAAVIPQDEHVLFRRVVFRAPADKPAQCIRVGHAGFFLLIHENEPALSVGPALQPVRGDGDARILIGLPPGGSAGFDDQVNGLRGDVFRDLAEIAGSQREVPALQVRAAQIEHDGPLGGRFPAFRKRSAAGCGPEGKAQEKRREFFHIRTSFRSQKCPGGGLPGNGVRIPAGAFFGPARCRPRFSGASIP